MDQIKFSNKLNEFLEKPFSLGDRSNGWDCVNSMREIFESLGIEFPKEFSGWTWENYAERWGKKPDFQIFKDFLFSLGEPVSINYLLPGDIIILEKTIGGEMIISAGVYLGNATFQAVSNPHGVVRMPLGFFSSAIVGARRLIKRQTSDLRPQTSDI
jgi:hypothetical protein